MLLAWFVDAAGNLITMRVSDSGQVASPYFPPSAPPPPPPRGGLHGASYSGCRFRVWFK